MTPDTSKLAAVTQSLLAQRAVKDREIMRLRMQIYDLERVVVRYVPDYDFENTILPPRDKGAIIRAREQYARRRARSR